MSAMRGDEKRVAALESHDFVRTFERELRRAFRDAVAWRYIPANPSQQPNRRAWTSGT